MTLLREGNMMSECAGGKKGFRTQSSASCFASLFDCLGTVKVSSAVVSASNWCNELEVEESVIIKVGPKWRGSAGVSSEAAGLGTAMSSSDLGRWTGRNVSEPEAKFPLAGILKGAGLEPEE